MTAWEFNTDATADEHYRQVANAMCELFGMSFEEAVCRINDCYRGVTFMTDPCLQPEMAEDEANHIVLGPSWWKDADDRQLRPPPADFKGVSVADSLNKFRKIPPYPDFTSMSSEELGEYAISGSYFHSSALGTLIVRLESSDVGETILKVLELAPPAVFDSEDGLDFGFIVGQLIKYGTEPVRARAWQIYDELPDIEKSSIASDYRRIYKEEFRR
ncbi:hypothetical protein ACWF9G_03970 [Nocardia sp. NPDC055029]